MSQSAFQKSSLFSGALTSNSVVVTDNNGTVSVDAALTFSNATKQLSLTGTFSQNSAYAKFGNAVPFAATTTGQETWGNDNTINGIQVGVGNRNSGTSAYGFFFLNNDLAVSGDYTHYAGIGLNSSGYTDNTFGTAFAVANQMQVINTDGNICYATLKSGSLGYHNWLVGGGATSNEMARLTATGLGILTTNPLSSVDVVGSMGMGIRTVTATGNVLSTDHTILADATSGAIVLTLTTSATSTRREYYFKKVDSSANTVTIKGNGSEVIINTTAAGANTLVITSTGSALTIQCNGTSWYVF